MKFILILVLVMTIVIMMTCWLLGYFCDGKRLKKARKIIIIADVVSVFGLSLSFTALQRHWLAGPLNQAITIAFMRQLIFVVVALCLVGVRKVLVRMLSVPEDAGRGEFLKGAAAVPIFAGAASVYASLYERKSVIIREFDVLVKQLDEKLEGYRIAQLSDVHLGPFMGLEDLQILLDKAAATKSDALVITGDLFDDRTMNGQAIQLVDSYCDSFPQGIIFCYGNHEHFRGISAIDLALKKTRIGVLVNNNKKVVDGTTPLYFAGVDYPMNRDNFDELQDVYTKKAMSGIPENAITIFLAHHPDFLDSAAEYNVRLLLSGHTHGGQLGFMGIPLVPPVFKYLRGWYRRKNTDCYVHSGNGSWFPYRLGCPPEIAVFRLKGEN